MGFAIGWHQPAPDPAAAYAQLYRIDRTLAAKIVRAADHYKVERSLVFRMVKLESNFDSVARSPSGATGLLQLLPSTAARLRPGTTRAELEQVELNLTLGLRYYTQLRTRYQGDRWLALVAYNYGMAHADTLRTRFTYPHNLLKGH